MVNTQGNKLVSISNFDAEFSNKQKLFIDLNIEIESGYIYGISGNNGIGKTSLLKIISQVNSHLKFNKSKIEIIDGITKNIVHQNYEDAIFQWFDIYRNIGLGMEISGLSKEESVTKVNEICEYFKFKPKSIKTTEISGGEKQIVVLLRALITKPSLLLLDEPFSAINNLEYGTYFRMNFLKYIKENNITPLIISHSPKEIIYFSDKILFLRNANEFSEIEVVDISSSKSFNKSNIDKTIIDVDNDIDVILETLKDKFNNKANESNL